MGRNTRMQQWINYRVRVTIQDGRMFVGTLSAFDRHMNVVLADCEEFRRKKTKKTTKQLSGSQDDEKEIKRTLGFVLVRGEGVISLTAEAPPPAEARRMGEGPVAGPGRGQVAGRGMQVSSLASAPAGLAGPVRGVGGPAPALMMPQRPGAMLPGQMGGAPPMIQRPMMPQ
eukprot:GHVU01049576.1.p1 GENE.GHVU01049576.1~~GHVU01049576.1.p1  ORF type:complete len:171 (+),score=18.14 GHVU01049576.1:211-723(+)